MAFTVCQHYGIDTGDYSFAYVAGWSHGKETPELKASLDKIRKTASEMITEIDEHLAALQKELGIEVLEPLSALADLQAKKEDSEKEKSSKPKTKTARKKQKKQKKEESR